MSCAADTQKKVEWLRNNRQLWDGIKWEKLHWSDYRHKRHALVNAMKAAGLYSASTNACDINVLRLIELATKPSA